MGGFYWGVLRFFRGFLFSSAAASSSLILSLLRFANSFASSRYFFCWSVFCLECSLFLRLDWVLLSLFYYGDLCAFRSTSCCLLNGFDLLSASHIPLQSIFPPANLLLSVDDIQYIYTSISSKNTRGRQFRCRISSS